MVGGQPPWEPSAGALALQTLAVLVAFTVFEALWDGAPPASAGRGRRAAARRRPGDRRARAAGARRTVLPAAGRPPRDRVRRRCAARWATRRARSSWRVLAGLGAGRILGLELLLRLVVERADPLRTFYVSLDADELDSPLLWRSAL